MVAVKLNNFVFLSYYMVKIEGAERDRKKYVRMSVHTTVFFVLLISGGILFFINSSSGGTTDAPINCNPGYLNQIYDVNIRGSGFPFSACTGTNNTCFWINNSNVDAFTAPLDYAYQKVRIINASILAHCIPNNRSLYCNYSINGIPCGSFSSGSITGIVGEQVYPVSCLSLIKPGINTIVINPENNFLSNSPGYPEDSSISKVFVEMSVYPANC